MTSGWSLSGRQQGKRRSSCPSRDRPSRRRKAWQSDKRVSSQWCAWGGTPVAARHRRSNPAGTMCAGCKYLNRISRFAAPGTNGARGRLAGAIRRRPCYRSRAVAAVCTADRLGSWGLQYAASRRHSAACRGLDFCASEVQCPHNCGKVDSLKAPHAMVWTCSEPILSPVGMCVSRDCTSRNMSLITQ